MDQENTTQFKKHEIVWAKVQGYPWWPAIVKPLNFPLNSYFLDCAYRRKQRKCIPREFYWT